MGVGLGNKVGAVMGGEKNQTVMGGEKNQTWMPLHMLFSGQGMSCSIEAASEQTIFALLDAL